MPMFKEYRLKLKLVVDGAELTPETMPMARLAEYVLELSAIMGHKEHVHLMRVEDGSTSPVIYVDAADESRIKLRIGQAAQGRGPREANAAYQRINRKLREDRGYADLIDWQAQTNVIEFPGAKRDLPQSYNKIKEFGSIAGKVVRVGGTDESIPVWLQRSDGQILYCEANELVSRELIKFYLQYVRVHGYGVWSRGEDGAWVLEKFKIQSYDQEALSDESLLSSLGRLGSVPNSGWTEIEDPLEEIRRIRHGEDEEP